MIQMMLSRGNRPSGAQSPGNYCGPQTSSSCHTGYWWSCSEWSPSAPWTLPSYAKLAVNLNPGRSVWSVFGPLREFGHGFTNRGEEEVHSIWWRLWFRQVEFENG